MHPILLAALLQVPVQPGDTLRIAVDDFGPWGRSARWAEELRIGRLDGPAELTFGQIADVAVDSRGILYAVDAQAPVILAFDSTGAFLRRVGAAGQGPGEYGPNARVEVYRGDSLAVWDAGTSRLSIFSPSGELARDVPVRLARVANTTFAVAGDGRFALEVDDPTWRRPHQASLQVVDLLVHSPEGELLETIDAPDPNSPGGTMTVPVPGGMLTNFGERAFHAFAPGGCVLTGNNRSYAFHVCIDGEPRVVVREWEPVEMASDERLEWETLIDRTTEATRRAGMSEAPLSLPDTKPAYSSFAVDAEGRAWITPYLTAERLEGDAALPYGGTLSWRQPVVEDAYAPDGRPLGRVEVPAGIRLLHRRGTRAWGLAQGEFGETYIVQLRLETLEPGSAGR